MSKKIIDLSMSEELTPYFVQEINGKEIKVGLEPLQVYGIPVWTKGSWWLEEVFPDVELTGWKYSSRVSSSMLPVVFDVAFIPRLILANVVALKDIPAAVCTMDSDVDLLIPIGVLRDVSPNYALGKDSHTLTVDVIEDVIKCYVVGNGDNAVAVRTELWEDLVYC